MSWTLEPSGHVRMAASQESANLAWRIFSIKKDSAEGEIAKLYKITDDHVLGHKDSE